MVKRVNVSFDEEVLGMIDDFSEQTHLSRSTVIQLACRDYIDAQKKIPSLEKKLTDIGNIVPFLKSYIDDELIRRLQDVQVQNK